MNILDIIMAKKMAENSSQPVIDEIDKKADQALEQSQGAQELVEEANQTLQETQETLTTLQTAVSDAQETIKNAEQAVSNVTEIEEQALAAAIKAEEASASFDQMKADLNTAAEDLVGEAVTTTVNKEVAPVKEQVNSLSSQVAAFESNLTDLEVDINDFDDEITQIQTDIADKSKVTIENVNTETEKKQKISVANGEDTTTIEIKNYTDFGENEDGSMTQKAVTDYVEGVKEELNTKIQEITIEDDSINLGEENAGKAVFVGEDGTPTAGGVSEETLTKMSMMFGTYQNNNVVGLELDYANKNFTRIQGASNLTSGIAFNKFKMFGGRRRCIVDDSGKIVAFEEEENENYIEDGTKGQVMVYQPKVYYSRVPLTTKPTDYGMAIIKEQILLSDKKQPGFSLHPLFINSDGDELDYILLPAYEGSCYKVNTKEYIKNDSSDISVETDYLSSIAGVKPMSSFTVSDYSQLAKNRGKGWSLTNSKVESLNQMLMLIEYGTPNLQNALGKGISDLENNTTYNISLLTGSTSSLGSESGRAPSSKNDKNVEYRNDGEVAISYRGYENPYGNTWRFVEDSTIIGTGENEGGVIYINNIATNCKLPNNLDWIPCFNYDEQRSWLFLPSYSSSISANSALPIGDYCYISKNLNGTNTLLAGGKMGLGNLIGAFSYYAALGLNETAKSINARIMFTPTINEIYNENCSKWQKIMEA